MGFFDAIQKNIEDAKKNVQLNYLGGHPALTKPMLLHIRREDDGIVFYRGSSPLTKVLLSDIKSVWLEKASSVKIGRTAAGAIAGGILLGPLGLIAGGALGARKKKDNSVIIMMIKQGVAETQVMFGGIGEEKIEPKYARFCNLIA